MGAHKFHGPRGIGALLLREDTKLQPFQLGGHQEADRRPGTELVALVAGMARALELWSEDRESRARKLEELRNRLESGLAEMCSPVVVNGSRKHRLPNTLNIAFPGTDGEALLVSLDLAGIGCSLGSTCASGSAEPAASLVAMGCPPEVYRSSIRLTLSVDTLGEEIEEAVRRIAGVVQQLRQSAAAESSARAGS